MPKALYIHIPFCIKKCWYCDFYSILAPPPLRTRYVDALCKEIGLREPSLSVLKSVYIGGGTPTTLSIGAISQILAAVKERALISPHAEISIEANPGTMTQDKADNLLSLGINRVSLGIQSLIDSELKLLGRSHNADDAVRAAETIRKAGFTNVSIDLIYGIPGQGPEEWQYTLRKAIELCPDHISAYELTLEEKTPLYRASEKGQITLPDEPSIVEMYLKGIDTLADHGYVHYEISNFAKPGFQCGHNLNYWNRGEYIGIGAGAHSFINGTRTAHAKDVVHYIESIERGSLPITERFAIRGDDEFNEMVFLGLRKTEGIDLRAVPEGKKASIYKAVSMLSAHGLVEIQNDHLRLTRKGLLLSNEVIVRVSL
ncbi:MAG: radical SAM family heme chaperone HemW [Dissulfurispiraceae bacterium]